jgi:alpha-L-fucosidase
VPDEATARLIPVGEWISQYGEAMYGKVERVDGRMEWMPTGQWTVKGNAAYYWCNRWPGSELAIGGLRTKVARATLMATGEPVPFEQTENRLVIRGLPDSNPDPIAEISVIKLECDGPPRQALGAGCAVL